MLAHDVFCAVGMDGALSNVETKGYYGSSETAN